MPAAEEGPDVDALTAEVRRRVGERYRSGEYPPDLESDLAQHFESVVDAQASAGDPISGLLRRVDDASRFSLQRIPSRSSLPMGSSLHRLIGNLVGRQTSGVLTQMRDFAEAVRAVLVAMTTPEVIESLDQARDRLQPLAVHLQGMSPVVDIRCGSGAMLDLLRDLDVEAVGVDPDPVLVSRAQARGHDARQARGVDYLAALPNRSLGGIFADSVARLPVWSLEELLSTGAGKLRAGGRLVMTSGRTVPARNPASGAARATTAADLVAMVRAAGYAEAEAELRAEGDEAGALEAVPPHDLPPAAAAAINRNFERLGRGLLPEPEFAVIATR